MTDKRHHCCYCGDDIGRWDRFSDHFDTCGRAECNRNVEQTYAIERAEAHEQLDRDLGYY